MSCEFKDSGERRDFGTGAVRDMGAGKGRFDLLPFDGLQEVARVYETGAEKYAARNWENGIPVWTFIDSAMRHLSKAASGQTDEAHLSMAAWNCLCAIQTAIWIREGKLPASLAYDQPMRLMRDPSPEDLADESRQVVEKILPATDCVGE